MGNQLDRHVATYGEDKRFFHENHLMELTYCQRVCASLAGRESISLLSLGLGHGFTSQEMLRTLGARLAELVVVEGSPGMIERYHKEFGLPDKMTIIEGYFETFDTDRRFDAIEIGFVLEHVDDPDALLRKYRGYLKEGGRILVAVPNALSLHRRLGQMAGFLDDPYVLGPMDLEFGHQRYFDLDSLRACVRDAGLTIQAEKGILLKPFTEKQLQSLDLPESVWQALLDISAAYPEISNAMFIEASL